MPRIRMLRIPYGAAYHVQRCTDTVSHYAIWHDEPTFDSFHYANDCEAYMARTDYYRFGVAYCLDGKRVAPGSTLHQRGDKWFLCPAPAA